MKRINDSPIPQSVSKITYERDLDWMWVEIWDTVDRLLFALTSAFYKREIQTDKLDSSGEISAVLWK